MTVLMNTWVIKEKKKKAHETAPSYESISQSEIKNDESRKRTSHAARATYKTTLRGVRK